jgi:hypothetical protein
MVYTILPLGHEAVKLVPTLLTLPSNRLTPFPWQKFCSMVKAAGHSEIFARFYKITHGVTYQKTIATNTNDIVFSFEHLKYMCYDR